MEQLTELLGIPLDLALAIAAAAVFLGGYLRGFVGFGAALVIVPVLSLAYGPHLAVAAGSVMGLPSMLQLLPEAIRSSEKAIVLPTSVAVMLATPLGTWALVLANPIVMKMVISALVVGMVAMLAKGWRLERKVGTPLLIGAGFAGGLVQGAAGIGGPPVVAIALSREGSPVQQRGNVLGLMTAITASSLAPLYLFGLYTREAIVLGLLLVPVYGVAIWLGSRYFSRGGAPYFRRAALVTLAIVGIVTLLVAVRDFFAA